MLGDAQEWTNKWLVEQPNHTEPKVVEIAELQPETCQRRSDEDQRKCKWPWIVVPGQSMVVSSRFDNAFPLCILLLQKI